MKTDPSPFTVFYKQWLGSWTSLIPGAASARPVPTYAQKPVQPAAVLDWEDEGGSVKPPEVKPDEKPAPKLPL